MREPFVKQCLATLLARDLPLGIGSTAHEFSSKGGQWALALTRDFLALTCHRYERWEHFKEQLQGPLAALQDVYSPAFFTRIGLRYRDVIRRSALGLEKVGWDQLLQPWIAGAFASPDVSADVEHSAHELLILLPDRRTHARVHHGSILDPVTQEQCYLIDADFFDDQQQAEPPHAIERLDYFNRHARLFFRWCIRERLHDAMRPRAVPAG